MAVTAVIVAAVVVWTTVIGLSLIVRTAMINAAAMTDICSSSYFSVSDISSVARCYTAVVL